LIALTILRLISRTDEKVVREHWKGTGDIVQIVRAMTTLAARILPPRIRRVLAARVEMQNDGRLKVIESR
jgi:hypothetical protein